MLVKTGELKEGLSRCENCGDVAVEIVNEEPLCCKCAKVHSEDLAKAAAISELSHRE